MDSMAQFPVKMNKSAQEILLPYFCFTGQSRRRALSRFALSGQEFSGSFVARILTGSVAEEYQSAGGKRFETNSYDVGQSFSVGLSTRF
jgi:hypothetical protein